MCCVSGCVLCVSVLDVIVCDVCVCGVWWLVLPDELLSAFFIVHVGVLLKGLSNHMILFRL